MENVPVIWYFILSALGFIVLIANVVKAFSVIFDPYVVIKKNIEEHGKRIKNIEDGFGNHTKGVEDSVGKIDEAQKVICKSLLVLLNHEITGNGIDRLKEQRDNMEQFLIDK
jgi:hypothetical protein